jgi:N-sulfoglucosamine sulfohydrolase
MKAQTRRDFLKAVGVTTAAFAIPVQTSCSNTKELPNILWLTSEDNSPLLGCYGDDFATTPNLDKFASEGILYENAFATVPVCAPARCNILTGVYPISMGTQHMRSRYPIPDKIVPYPTHLKNAGYYCTNNSKTDYNYLGDDKSYWDECKRDAHYKNRAEGQPFFAIFNFTTSHESSIHKSVPTEELRHDPAKVKLPPYHPDTPDARHDWAQYYDKVEDMDKQVGLALQELEDAGLAENTVVMYYADHGGILARSKRFVYDTGLHVPMMARFPKKCQHLATHKPGSRTDRLVTFVDLPATLLSLAGIKKPDYMQGQSFLGKYKDKERDYACSFRGRMDERYDFCRTVRDKKFRYIRNYNPHRIYGQFIEYLWRAPLTKSWEEEFKAGRLNETQSIFWNEKPAEELYNSVNDPWEVNNLVDDPIYKNDLERMRKANKDWMLEIFDAGFMPEGEYVELSKTGTTYDFVRSEKYNLEKIIDAADLATSRNPNVLNQLVESFKDKDKFVRYWAVTGCLILGDRAKSATSALKEKLNDSYADVRVTAAETLCNLGNVQDGLPVLIKELSNANTKVALHAANSIQYIGQAGKPALNALKEQFENSDNYVGRAAKFTAKQLEL